MDDDAPATKVIGFPYARSGLAKTRSKPRNLGLTAMSKAVAPSGTGARGHWCKSCRGSGTATSERPNARLAGDGAKPCQLSAKFTFPHGNLVFSLHFVTRNRRADR